MNILDYTSGKKESSGDKLSRLKKGKSKEERREIEFNFGKPKKVIYPNIKPIEDKDTTITFSYDNEEELKLITKYFKVYEFNGKNINDINLLLTFLRSLDKGHIYYDKETDTFKIKKYRQLIDR